MIYLDWAASAPPEKEALDAAREFSSRHYANPSSVHSAGKAAREELEKARECFVRALGGGHVVFTSGATESNSSLLLAQLARQALAGSRGSAAGIVVSALEHASVYEQAQRLRDFGLACAFVSPGRDGIIDPGNVAGRIGADTVLVSVMLVNNETGVMQPIADIARAVRAARGAGGRRILVHTDAAQAFGKVPFKPLELGVDAASLSGHKMGGPRGIGALWLTPNVSPAFPGAGGGQESGFRAGTENLPGIAAFRAAAEKRMGGLAEELAAARGKRVAFVNAVRGITGIRFFPENPDGPCSPYILCFGFPPLPGDVLVRHADSRGFLIGSGSACSSRKKNRTRVLESMGIAAETALSAVRVSFGPSTDVRELESFAEFLRTEAPSLLGVTAGPGG